MMLRVSLIFSELNLTIAFNGQCLYSLDTFSKVEHVNYNQHTAKQAVSPGRMT